MLRYLFLLVASFAAATAAGAGDIAADTVLTSAGVVVQLRQPPAATPAPASAGQLQTPTSPVPALRRWQLNFVQQTHTDIGYTRSQMEILGEHLRFIDAALDYCDATDALPDDAKFRWTCETAWAVSEWLKNRPPAQIERLKRRVREGRISLTAMYLNFDGLPDEQTLAASLYPLKQFRDAGLKCELAMQNDVNGIGWLFAELFPTLGVKYIELGIHAERALEVFDKPTVFWWQSPSGKKILTYRTEQYHKGNFLGVVSQNFPEFERKVLAYLASLQRQNYPLDIAVAQHSGFLVDNSAPSMLASQLIKQWNEKFVWPKLRCAVADEFFHTVEKNHANTLQTIRGAWPDWWTDGFGTGQREAAALRKTSAAATAAQTALALAKLLGAKIPQSTTGELAEIYKQLLFYGEHTFGANDSVSRPHDLRAWDQRNIKQSYVWDAVRRTGVLTENATGLLQTFTPPATVPTLVVFNPLNFAFTGITRVFLDQQIVPHGRDFEITDAAGNRVPAQFDGERWSDGAYWNVFVKNVPPLGFAQYKITVKKERAKRPFSVRKMTYTIGENQFYRFQFNRERGTLISLYDKELKRELLTRNTPQKTPAAAPAAWEFGQFIYETIDNREKTVNGCPTCRGGYKKNFKQPDFKRRAPEKMRFDYYERGEIYDLYRFVGETIAGEGANNLVVEYRTYNTTKKIEVAHYLRKRSETSPEAVYVAFPLAIENGKIFLDETGGEFEAGVGQLRGSANDYYTVQNYAAARNGAMQALVVSPEIPLMQFGAINTARYTAGAVPQNTNIYSWPMNNYWFTNFNAMQFGGTRWRHFITSLADTSPATATRFAFANRIPMLTRVLPAAGNANTEKMPVKTTLAEAAVPAVPVNSTPAETAVSATPLPPPASFLSITGGNVLLARAFPLTGENAIVLQLREIAGNPASLRITSPRATLTAITECDPLGDPLPHTADGTIAGDATTGSTAGTTTGDRTADAAGKISLRPWETKFVKIHF